MTDPLARLEQALDAHGDLIEEVDGFWYYWPRDLKGCLSEYELLAIAAILRQRNASGTAQVMAAGPNLITPPSPPPPPAADAARPSPTPPQ